MKDLNYKLFHESLTSNNNGTTAIESTLVIIPSIISVYILTLIRSLQDSKKETVTRSYWSQFFLEFFIIIMPSIMCFTILADHLVIVYGALFLIGIVLLLKNHVLKTMLTSCFGEIQWKTHRDIVSYRSDPLHRSYITNFRAITNMLTVLCILAVDFHIFPRRFAKTETFGYGVMDFGVGLFIVGNALVHPEAQFKVGPRIWKTALQCIPLIFLGIGRLILTNQVEYHEHVTEYGQHWNFFFTLAVTKLACSIILKTVKGSTNVYFFFTILMICSYETVLQCGLQKWILGNAPRLDLVSANREGLASIVGYVALYFGGVSLGRILRRFDTLNPVKNLRLAKILVSISTICWIVTYTCDKTFGISRRLANCGYLFWMISFTTTVLACLLVIECFSLYLKYVNVFSKRSQPNPNVAFVPNLLAAINFNGLTFFLLANLFTGIINLKLKTFNLNPVTSLIILILYMLLNCMTVSVLHHKKIKLL
ncbi:uncharacterized protein LOC113214250 [Frankliniella occidentalis]|uniref:Phosphatidylinositol-glycan biosynthesis class W protein n=1 Tax=Frankliniella occidentalis TaxID=133901 RepID=A0A6J1T913_FRAOC|nr:uncharacterized protein LOC113214250 [Frankliniella occidentalis]